MVYTDSLQVFGDFEREPAAREKVWKANHKNHGYHGVPTVSRNESKVAQETQKQWGNLRFRTTETCNQRLAAVHDLESFTRLNYTTTRHTTTAPSPDCEALMRVCNCQRYNLSNGCRRQWRRIGPSRVLRVHRIRQPECKYDPTIRKVCFYELTTAIRPHECSSDQAPCHQLGQLATDIGPKYSMESAYSRTFTCSPRPGSSPILRLTLTKNAPQRTRLD
jgi:hypothetical protein